MLSTSAPVHLHDYVPEILTPYQPHQLPDIFIRSKVCHSSDFRQDAIFSDLLGRFPISAFDGSQYLLVSVLKRYIHVEPLLNRTTDQLVAAYTATHQWFQAHGHHPECQILDNEAPTLLAYFTAVLIAYQLVPPFTTRASKAERAVLTFKRHFIAVLADTHLSFPIDQWSELLPQAEFTLNMMRSYANQPAIFAYQGIYRAPYDFLAHPIAPCGTLVVVHDPQKGDMGSLCPSRIRFRSVFKSLSIIPLPYQCYQLYQGVRQNHPISSTACRPRH
jgi:hypothetical protein